MTVPQLTMGTPPLAGTSVMINKAIEMEMNSLTRESITKFKYTAEIACKTAPNLNPAIWISREILNQLVTQYKKDLMEKTKLPNGEPNYAEYPEIEPEDFVAMIGERGLNGELIGVQLAVRVMTRCVVDTTHLYENCLLDFQNIDCRGNTLKLLRGLHKIINKTCDHWKTTMEYTIDQRLASEIIRTLNNKIREKNGTSTFLNSWSANKNKALLQMKNAKSDKTPENNLQLWVNVMDYTLQVYENQIPLEHKTGDSYSKKHNPSDRNKNKGTDNKQKKTSPEDTKKMICFKCGKKGVKTGHDGCSHSDKDPSTAGAKALEEYKKKSAKSKNPKTTMATVEETGEDNEDESEDGNNSDSSHDVCMISWDYDSDTRIITGAQT